MKFITIGSGQRSSIQSLKTWPSDLPLGAQSYPAIRHGAANKPSRRVRAYRKAAWAIEDTPQDLGLIYRAMGVRGLKGIENVGPKMAQVVEALIKGAQQEGTAVLGLWVRHD